MASIIAWELNASLVPIWSSTNTSAPRPVTSSPTFELSPWMTVTTAMIDVTATMIPSSVRNDRSLLPRSEWSAEVRASQKFTEYRPPGERVRSTLRHPDPVGERCGALRGDLDRPAHRLDIDLLVGVALFDDRPLEARHLLQDQHRSV